jgi:hypothetical protein
MYLTIFAYLHIIFRILSQWDHWCPLSVCLRLSSLKNHRPKLMGINCQVRLCLILLRCLAQTRINYMKTRPLGRECNKRLGLLTLLSHCDMTAGWPLSAALSSSHWWYSVLRTCNAHQFWTIPEPSMQQLFDYNFNPVSSILTSCLFPRIGHHAQHKKAKNHWLYHSGSFQVFVWNIAYKTKCRLRSTI